MKISILLSSLILSATFLLTPLTASANEFETAKKAAMMEINKAKSMGFEWRDSVKKFVGGAEKAEKAGDHKKAMKLLAKAKQQGVLAQRQAKDQKNAGPH